MSDSVKKVIRADHRWLNFDFRNLINYRDLLLLMVRREFVAKYKQTILGPLWFLIQPILLVSVFVFLFSETMHVPTDGIPPVLFYLSGIVVWNFLAGALAAISVSILHQAELCKKVYFPRIFLPLAQLISCCFALVIQSVLLAGIYVYFYFCHEPPLFSPSFQIIFVPIWILQLSFLSLGMGTWIAALTTRYRDFHHLTQLGLTLWMYASPISYSLNIVSPKWKWLVLANPVSSILLSIRAALFGSEMLSLNTQMMSFFLSIAICFTGVVFFNRVQRNFIDTV